MAQRPYTSVAHHNIGKVEITQVHEANGMQCAAIYIHDGRGMHNCCIRLFGGADGKLEIVHLPTPVSKSRAEYLIDLEKKRNA